MQKSRNMSIFSWALLSTVLPQVCETLKTRSLLSPILLTLKFKCGCEYQQNAYMTHFSLIDDAGKLSTIAR